MKSDFEARREQLDREQEAELDAQKKRQFDGAMIALDSLNRGDAHTNFHGLQSVYTTFQIAVNSLRRHYISHREVAKAHAALPPIAAEDPDHLLRALVDRCVVGGEKAFTVWSENQDELKAVHCGKDAFNDIVRRKKLDPFAKLRLKRGRPEILTPELVQHIAGNKSKDLQGIIS